MFNSKKSLRRIVVSGLVTGLLVGQATMAYAANTPNTLSVSPSNPTAAASGVTLTWTESGYQTSTAVKCVKVTYSVNADGTGGLPSGMVVSGTSNLGGTLLSGGTYAHDDTSAGSGSVVYNYSTGITPSGTAKTITIGTITNPSSAGTTYVSITTYDTAGSGSSGACGGNVLDNQVFAGLVTTSNTQYAVTVLPNFSISVANQSSACNGESNFVTGAGTATAVNLGNMVDSANVSGGQLITTSGNSTNGFVVYVRGTQATQNLRSTGHNWTDVAGTYASPAALGAGERFGYTYHDNEATGATTTNPASANFAAMTSTNEQIMGSSSTDADTGCISYDAQSGATTPAGLYTGTSIYTAVPDF